MISEKIEGSYGFKTILIPASSGVLLPFFKLQDKQQVTKLFQVLLPPLDLGITW